MKIKTFLLYVSVAILSLKFISCSSDQNKAFEINNRLDRGINFGNMLEAPYEGAWGTVIKEEYFKLIAEEGFQTIRLPIRWSAHTDSIAPYKIDSVFMARVKWAVDNALKNKLHIIINIHHFQEIFENPSEHKEKLFSIWKQISDQFKAYPDSLLFELFNEPHDKFTAELWNECLKKLLEIVRVQNPDRNIIIGTAEWGGLYALNKLVIPKDPNLILTIHYYNPFHFTHQGASWNKDAAEWLGTTWSATESEINDLNTDMNMIKNFADSIKLLVFIGEFGAYNKADIESRVKWTYYCTRKFEELGFSWAYWEFCSGFGIYDAENSTWRAELVNALLDKK